MCYLNQSYYAVVFAGINLDFGNFDHPAREIVKRLKLTVPDCRVNAKTIYPYDSSVSGDTVSDTIQVVKNAYNLCGNTIDKMANEVIKGYSGEDYIFFVGYSGGGVAATRVAEKLMNQDFQQISKILRVGSPVLTVGKSLYGRVADLVLIGDPVTQIEIPRLFKRIRPYQCFIKDLVVTRYTHSCYFREDLRDKEGITNLTKTIDKILIFVKN